MSDAVGQSLSFGVGVAVSPAPIIAMVLMLGTARARSNGPAFLAGWVAGIAIVGGATLLLAGGAGASEQGQPADWVSWLKLVLGLLLFVVAARQWRSRPGEDEDPELPAWMATVDRFTVPRATGFGFLLSGVNPKNLLLVVGGAAAIAQTGVSAGSQAVALGVFAVVASVGTGLPLVLYFALGDRSEGLLDRLKERMARNNAAIMAVVCLIIGAKLVGDAISGLG